MARRVGRAFTAVAWVALAVCPAAARQSTACDPRWLAGDAIQGVDGEIHGVCSIDFDGPGPAPLEVFIGGRFSVAGSALASNIARWDGDSWRPLGPGLDATVRALAAFDPDSDGPRPPVLIAGGEFLHSGAVPVRWIAQWDGTEWNPLAQGVFGTGPNARVEALAEFDPDGPGPAIPELIAAGRFSSAGTVSMNNIARWDGMHWNALGSGLASTVHALAVFQADGAPAPQLVAGGAFTAAGSAAAARIAAWNGVSWVPLGSGINNTVFALHAFTSEGGPARLIAGGQFENAGGTTAPGVAAWDGNSWSAMGAGLGSSVRSIRSRDPDGAGPAPRTLFAAGSFSTGSNPPVRNVARWDGSAWHQLGGGTSSSVNALETLPDGSGLLAGGAFAAAEGIPVGGLARWDNQNWQPFGTGTNDQVLAAVPFDPDGPGPQPEQLVIGGEFTSIGSTHANRLAIGDGLNWNAIGSGADGIVRAVATWDPDGAGPRQPLLAVGGDFTSINGQPCDDIALWDGQSFGTESIYGLNYGGVLALTTYDLDGPGPNPAFLVALGEFELGAPNGGILRHIAYWNGSDWLPFGTGEMTLYAFTATTFDFDGPGPNIPEFVVGGSFPNIDHAFHNHVASWNGIHWRSLGQGLGTTVSQWVLALAPYDPDGPGPAPERLFAGGTFTATGAGVPASYIAFFDGTEWQPLGSGANGFVTRLLPFRMKPSDPLRLLALGTFSSMDGVPAAGAAVWDGAAWTALGLGIGAGASSSQPSIPSGAVIFRPDGAATDRLFVLGNQTRAGGRVAASISQWGNDATLWRAPVSGNFESGSSWACGATPAPLERARFDAGEAGYAPSSYTVTLGGARAETSIRSLDVVTDRVSLDLGANTLRITGDSPSFSRAGLQVAGGSAAAPTLTITAAPGSAGELSTSGLVIGAGPGTGLSLQRGTLRVLGAATIAPGPDHGRLGIEGAATVSLSGPLTLAAESGAVAEIDIVAPGADLRLAQPEGSADIGLRGAAFVRIGGHAAAGGAVTSDAELGGISFASYAGASADVSIQGPGASWSTAQRRLFVGQAGHATLQVLSGATMSTRTSERAVIGRFEGGGGIVRVDGAGSRWREETSPMEVGPVGALSATAGGQIEAPGFILFPGATISGDGVIRSIASSLGAPSAGLSPVLNGGVISPGSGSALATITVDADLVSTVSGPAGIRAGVVAIDAGGPEGQGESDRLAVLGHVALAGTLRVSLREGFDPPAGTRFTILTAAEGMTGGFDVATFPGLPGRFFRLDYIRAGAGAPARVDVVVEAQTSARFRSSAYAAPGVPSAALLADLNADDLPDLVLAVPDAQQPESQPGQVAILVNAGSAASGWNGFASEQITIATGRAPLALAAGRFRGPSAPVDLAAACAADNQVRVHRGTGGPVPSFPAFTNVPSGGMRPVALRAADLDNDADIDLALANFGDINPPPEVQLPDRGNARVLVNDGAGTLTLGPALSTGWYPRSLALLDYNADGFADIVTADSGTNEISTFASRPPQGGSPVYQPPVRYPIREAPIDVEPGGLDNPKDPNDLTVIAGGGAGGQAAALFVFLHSDPGGSGAAPFLPPAEIPLPGEPLDFAPLDLDDDADTDLAVLLKTTPSAPPRARVLRNDSSAAPGTGVVLTLDPDPASDAPAELVLAGDVDADGRDDLVLIGPAIVAGTALSAGEGTSRVSVARAAPPCPADLDQDGAVAASDLALLLAAYARPASESPASRTADLNADGVVDTRDLVRLLARFGAACG